MSRSKNDAVFYNQSVSWIEPAWLGFIVLVLTYILNFHFYYIHYFLFAISALCFVFSFRKYALIDERSVTILFGISSAGITLTFDQIESVKSGKRKVNGVFRVGGMCGGLPNCIKEIEYVIINLKTPLAKQYDPKKINKYEMDSEDKKIEITEDRLGIILYQPPKYGFRPFLDALAMSVEVLNADMFVYENKFENILMAITQWVFASVGIVCMLYIISRIALK